MTRQAIRQATCTECGESEDNHRVRDKQMIRDFNILKYAVSCSCGANAAIVVDEEGTHASSNISYDDATWNEEEEE